MKTIFTSSIFLIFCSLCFVNDTAKAQSTQTFINKLWEDRTGNPDTIEHSSTVYDSHDNIIICGNTIGTGLFTDMLLTKYDKSGNVLWQTTYDNNSYSDYGVAITVDADDTIYVAATSVTSLTNGFDYVILKYDPDGNLLWETTYNGTASSIDVPADIAIDGSNNIYVTGASTGSTTQFDYLTMQLDQFGNINWSQAYNENSLNDFAAAINYRSGMVNVYGGSQATTTNWDITAIQYTSGGTQYAIYRDTTIYDGFDRVSAVAKATDGSLFITGRSFNGIDYDIRTIKLDSTLTFEWRISYDGGYNDEGNDIKVDAFGNVYVCGKVELDNNITKGILIAYDASGSQLWEQGISAPTKEFSSEARKISITGVNQITVASRTESANGYYINFFTKDLSGTTIWSHDYFGSPTYDNIPISLKTESNGDIYLTSVVHGDTSDYLVIKFNTLDVPYPISFDSTHSNFVSNQVIVKFNPDIVNIDFIDNYELEYALPEDVLPDSVLNLIGIKLGVSFAEPNDIKLLKIYDWMTYSDSLSITRLGDTIVMDKLWSTFIMTLPTSLNEIAAMDSLNTLVPDTLNMLSDLFRYSELNILQMEFAANDDYKDFQISLLPNTTFPDASINIDPAWDIEAGQSYIKVAVIGKNPIDWAHSDFSTDGTLSYNGSVIVDGHDFSTNAYIGNIDMYSLLGTHNTKCAGIIGAIRNNETTTTDASGIAGISGGDFLSTGLGGVSLYSVSCSLFVTSEIANAIAYAAVYVPLPLGFPFYSPYFGYGVDIENYSNGTDENLQIMQDAVKTIYDNHCVFVASRGNKIWDDSYTTTMEMYPACISETHDARVINVGASGDDGNHKVGYGVIGDGNGDHYYESMFEHGVDLIAPGAMNIVLTTNVPYLAQSDPVVFPFAPGGNVDQNYTLFNGTSASAPHVAGVAALMMSLHNTNPANPHQGYPNNLDNTDIEILMENYASPTPANEAANIVGAGKLNAGAVMQMIESPNYWVQHGTTYSETITTHTAQPVTFSFTLIPMLFPAGTYNPQRIEIVRNYIMTLPFGSVNPTLINHWLRHVTGQPNSSTINKNDSWADFSYSHSGNSVSVTITTNCYKLFPNINYYYPAAPSDIVADFSLHLHDAGATGIIEDKSTSDFLTVYPSPTSEYAFVSFITTEQSNTFVSLVDLTGTIIQNISLPDLKAGSHFYNFEVADLPSGIYFIRLCNKNCSIVNKLIKTSF